MDPQKAIHIKQEETDCAPDERGLMSDATLAMAHQQTTYIKQEETDCAPDEPGLTFPVDPLQPEVPDLPIKPDPELKLHIATSENNNYGTLAIDHQQTTYIKEEETDCSPNEPGLMFPEDPLKCEVPGLPINPGPELKLNVATSENNSVEYPWDISWPTDFIKEEPALNLEEEDTATIVVASRNYASNSTRLMQNESRHISIEETLNRGVVHSELELHSKESVHFPVFGEEEEKGGDQGYAVMEQSEEQCSSMEAWKTSGTSFNNISNTTINENADIRDIHDKDGTSNTTDNINAHNGLLPLKRPHKCDVCGKSFSHLGSLKKHGIIHTGMKPYKCDICDKSFGRLDALKNHGIIHTGMKPYKCDICGKFFSQLSDLKKHTLIHSGIKPHKCDICGKYFGRLGNLKRHILIHTGIKPHKCNICGKSFSRSGSLKKHILMHSRTTAHKCDICGKFFSWLSDLKRHTLIHSGIKQHKCNICGKYFSQLGHLNRHILMHSGTEPHM